MGFPMTEIGGFKVSRMICGSNSFHGFSHFSAARSEWLRQYFTPERIYEVLEVCVQEGINATVSIQREDYWKILDEIERNTGQHVVWIGTPGGRTKEDLMEGIRQCADMGVEICMPHTSYTDPRLIIAEERIDTADEILPFIRKLGMIPGWSTHRPEVITVSDRAGYDVEVYIQPYNSIGFLCSVETDWVGRVISQTPKPVICIKPLGAGRIMPPTGLNFVYHSIKPIDPVCIGLMSPQEAREDIGLARAILEGLDTQHKLQYTRSKQPLAASG
jgi:hypothetical protein